MHFEKIFQFICWMPFTILKDDFKTQLAGGSLWFCLVSIVLNNGNRPEPGGSTGAWVLKSPLTLDVKKWILTKKWRYVTPQQENIVKYTSQLHKRLDFYSKMTKCQQVYFNYLILTAVARHWPTVNQWSDVLISASSTVHLTSPVGKSHNIWQLIHNDNWHMAYLTIEGAIYSHFLHKNLNLKYKTWLGGHAFFYMDLFHGNTNSRVKIYSINVIVFKIFTTFHCKRYFLMDRVWPSKFNISR